MFKNRIFCINLIVILLLTTFFINIHPVDSQNLITSQKLGIVEDWSNIGLYGGTISGFAFDPVRGEVYACVQGAFGIYKSSIHEIIWEPVEGALGQCYGIAFDPISDRIYWADGTFFKISQAGSIDWYEPIEPGEPYTYHPIAQLQNETEKLFVGTLTGFLFYTSDSGDTWTQSQFLINDEPFPQIDGDIFQIVINPLDPENIFLATGGNSPDFQHRGVFESKDGGLTFEQIFINEGFFRTRIAISYTGDVYVSVNGEDYKRPFESQDFDLYFPCYDPDIKGSFAGNLYFHPDDPNVIWKNSSKSEDFGCSFINNIPNLYSVTPYPTEPGFHTTFFGVNFVRPLISMDEGETFNEIPQGMEEIPIEEITTDPHDFNRLVVGRGAIGTSLDGGENWDYPILTDKCCDFSLSPHNSQEILVASGTTITKSVDWGQNWEDIGIIEVSFPDHIESFIRKIVIDSSNKNRMWAAVSSFGENQYDTPLGGVWVSSNQGETWTNLNLEEVGIYGLAHIPSQDILIAGARYHRKDPGAGGIYIKPNVGYDWIHPENELYKYDVYEITVDPHNPNNIYAGVLYWWEGDEENPTEYIGGLFRSNDFGMSWTRLTPIDLHEAREITFDPEDPNAIYILSGNNIYRSLDSGSTWNIFYEYQLGDGIPKSIFISWIEPNPVSSVNVILESDEIKINWQSSLDEDYGGTMVRYSADHFPSWYGDGELLEDVTGNPDQPYSISHANPPSGKIYYSLFAYDENLHYAKPVQIEYDPDVKTSIQFSEKSAVESNQRVYIATSRGGYSQVLEKEETFSIFIPLISR